MEQGGSQTLDRASSTAAVGRTTERPAHQSRHVVMLYSLSFQPFEGWYRRVYNQARSLIADGCRVTVLAWDRGGKYPEEENRDGIEIQRFRIPAGISQGPRNGINHLKFGRAVSRFLRRYDFDVVHCFNVDTMPVGLRVARRERKKAVLDLCEPEYYRGFWKPWHGWLLHGINWLERTLAKRFDLLFVHNGFQMEKFRRAGVSRLTRVGSYPDRSLLSPNRDRGATDTLVIGRIGTVYANTGFEEIAAAFGELLRKQSTGGGPRYKLRLAGNVFDKYRTTFDDLIRPLEGHVEVTGAFDVSQLAQLYSDIDISLLLYNSQAFRNVTPTKLFESMACGVPVVASAIGDMTQIVTEGECGVIVDERDPASICAGIEKLASDPALRRRMAENAVRLAHDNYTWEAVEAAFLDAYRGL